jgi:hypothetical protein
MGLFTRRTSDGTNTTRVHSHDPTNVPGETTDGSGPLYPNVKQVMPHHEGEKDGDGTVFGDKSPGVRRIEIIGQFFNGWHKWVLFFFIFLISCTSPSLLSRDELTSRCLRVCYYCRTIIPSGQKAKGQD